MDDDMFIKLSIALGIALDKTTAHIGSRIESANRVLTEMPEMQEFAANIVFASVINALLAVYELETPSDVAKAIAIAALLLEDNERDPNEPCNCVSCVAERARAAKQTAH